MNYPSAWRTQKGQGHLGRPDPASTTGTRSAAAAAGCRTAEGFRWVVHRDDRFWEEPAAFEPSRWERESDRPAYAYFPFSGGPRHCIGMRFARLELVVALATMVQRVDLNVSVSEPLTFAPTISLQPETAIEATVRRC
ncbi:cytochrome P450 [Haladaptatus sp. NG-WS-4]